MRRDDRGKGFVPGLYDLGVSPEGGLGLGDADRRGGSDLGKIKDPLSVCRKRPVTHRIATTTCATGFFNAIRVLILRREPSPLPDAIPTGFTTDADPVGSEK